MLEKQPQPRATGREREKDRDLVVAAEPAHTQEEPAECSTRVRSDAAPGAKKEQEDQGTPNGAVDHLRPIGVGYVAAETECDACRHGCDPAAAQVACE